MIRVTIEPSAERDLDELETTVARAVRDKLAELERHPEPHRWLEKLKAHENSYRLRIRDWRAVGILEGNLFRIMRILHRRDDYRSVKHR